MAKKINSTKRRVTFIDIALILALVVLVGFVVYKVFVADKDVSDGNSATVEYTIKV